MDSKSRWTLAPTTTLLRRQLRRLLRVRAKRLESVASKVWEVAPGGMLKSLPAYHLPGQLERVTKNVYAYHWGDEDHPTEPESLERQMAGGIERYQTPTKAFLLKDAYLLDGGIHKAGTTTRVYPRSKRLPGYYVEDEIARGAVYGTIDGNLFFGLWLADDCVIYPLAASEGIPITTELPRYSHAPVYEEWLEMKPRRLSSAFFREVVLFEDRLQNQDKRARFRALTQKLLSRLDASPHPGVYIARGDSGVSRNLQNEMELADYLKTRRGFRVVDVRKADVPTLLAACAGAEVVVGVEGSHMVHGMMVLEPGKSLLMLQPPNRFSPVFKRTTDRDDQHYGFVVGHPAGEGFRVDPVEVERTIDLFPRVAATHAVSSSR
jgi:hypothetical protein